MGDETLRSEFIIYDVKFDAHILVRMGFIHFYAAVIPTGTHGAYFRHE